MSERSLRDAEEWRPVVGWENIYSVSNHGRVRRDRDGIGTHAGRILSPILLRNGRLNAHLRDRQRCKPSLIHRLVLAAFVGPCPAGYQCRHLDGDPANNHVSNLRWGTAQENADDRARHGTTPRGERQGLAKLNDAAVREIRTRRRDGMTLIEIAKLADVSINAVWLVLKGKTWKHVR